MRRTILTLALLAAIPALAALPIPDFRVPPLPEDDFQSALHLVFDVWRPDAQAANRVAAADATTPDGFLVAAFLANRTGKSIEEIWAAYEKGETWWALSARYGVKPGDILVPVDKDYGPPYGKAWGYRQKKGQVEPLSDAEFASMVRVRTMVKATGMTPDQVIEKLKGGEFFERWAGDVYRKKHGRSKDQDVSKGKGKGKAKGH